MKEKTIIALIILSILLFISCKEENDIGTLRLVLETESSKTLQKSVEPQASANRISKYNVSGKGAGGKTFSKDSLSRSITLDGISTGEWEISASAISQGGNIILSGNKTVRFAGGDSKETITLYEKAGKGSAEITVEGLGNLEKPTIQVTLEKIGKNTDVIATTENNKETKASADSDRIKKSEKTITDRDKQKNASKSEDVYFTETYVPKARTNSYSFEIKELDSGCYIMNISLSDDATLISSLAETIRICNNTSSLGIIDFTPLHASSRPSYDDQNNLTAEKKAEIPVSNGRILRFSVSYPLYSPETGSKCTMHLASNEDNVSFQPLTDDIKILWYADGILKQTVSLQKKAQSDAQNNSVQNADYTFSVQDGTHIISCIIINYTNGTCSGTQIKYNGRKTLPKGTANLLSVLYPENKQDIHLSGSSTMGFLPNGKILLLNPSTSTLQILKIQNKKTVLDNNATFSPTNEKYIFLNKAKKLCSSVNSDYFAITDGSASIHILKYDENKNTVSLAKRITDDSEVCYNGVFSPQETTFNNITSLSVCPEKISSGKDDSVILFSDNASDHIYLIQTKKEGVKNESFIRKKQGFSSINAISLCNNKLLYCSNNDLLYTQLEKTNDSDGNYAQSITQRDETDSWFSPENSDCHGAYKCAFLNSENVLAGTRNAIKRLSISSVDSTAEFIGDISVNSSDFALTPNREYLYICSPAGTFHSVATNYAGIFKMLDTFQTNANFKQVSATDDYVVALDTNGLLYLFEISNGE